MPLLLFVVPLRMKRANRRDDRMADIGVEKETLVEIAPHGEGESARVAAGNSLLDRGWGKPREPIRAAGAAQRRAGDRPAAGFSGPGPAGPAAMG
jgi:hypothetical protein